MTRKVNVLVVEDGVDEFFKRAHEHARMLDRGELLPGETTIIFEDPAQLLGMLTKERKRLLHSLRDEGATPLAALAERLGRDRRSVSRDVTAMREHGLVKTKYVVGAGKRRNLVVAPAAKRLELKAAI
jgi:predicted transcriptional regulator